MGGRVGGTRAWADAVALAARAGDALVEEDAQVAAFLRRGAAETRGPGGAQRERDDQMASVHDLGSSVLAV